jgi:hypothetical protein
MPTNTPEDFDGVDKLSGVLGELFVGSVSLMEIGWIIVDTLLSEVVGNAERDHFVVGSSFPHPCLGAWVVELCRRIKEAVHATRHAPDGGGEAHVLLIRG